jgi:chemotaxis methyl-accepting protein methylase
MLLADVAKRSVAQCRVQVFATDVDEDALAFARRGRYPARSALGMDPELRAQYMFDEGEYVRVSEALRSSCLFSRHAVVQDAPFPRLDLIVCDRVFEGLAPPECAALVARLWRGLRPGGVLLALNGAAGIPASHFEPISPGCFRARPGA